MYPIILSANEKSKETFNNNGLFVNKDGSVMRTATATKSFPSIAAPLMDFDILGNVTSLQITIPEQEQASEHDDPVDSALNMPTGNGAVQVKYRVTGFRWRNKT